MMTYYERPLAGEILRAHSKVVVLEGARAVGKSTLARRQLESHGYAYYTLADAGTLRQASSDAAAWIQRIRVPAIIDEAQLAKDIPLAVKEYTDQKPGQDILFILTGSASIARSGLGGQDPLTRRVRRFSLYPLTQAELYRSTFNIVDSFWHSEPDLTYGSRLTMDDLGLMMSTGGFPKYAVDTRLMSTSERGLSIRDDIDSVLGDTLLPEERFDKNIAQKILQRLLVYPGGILNVSKVASELGYDVRTINRYISIFIRRFLIHTLPNLATRPTRQPYARAKVHPVDTSFSVEALRMSGHDMTREPEEFGNLLESFVVQQVIPACQWSQERPDCFYWREAGVSPREVDLVLKNDAGKLVGIEVKSSETVKQDDFKGLRALASRDGRLSRGFVIYTGSQVIKEDDRLWAIPVSALWEDGAFVSDAHGSLLGNPVMRADANPLSSADALPVDANVFLSYSHADDAHLGGAIIGLVDQIKSEYEYEMGSTLNVFVDKRSINWGEDWKAAMNGSLGIANVLMPAVTPRYLRNPACRDELTQFDDRMRGVPGSQVLSLVWQDYGAVRRAMPNDPVLKVIDKHQRISVSELRGLSIGSTAYQAKVAEIVSKLRELMERGTAHEDASDIAEKGHGRGEADGLIEAFDRLGQDIPPFNDAVARVVTGIDDISAFAHEHPAPSQGSATSYLAWSQTFGEGVGKGTKTLREGLKELTRYWGDVHDALNHCLAVLISSSDADQRREGLRTMEHLAYSIRQSTILSPSARDLLPMARMLQAASPRPAPLAWIIEEATGTFGAIESSCNSLLDRIRSVESMIGSEMPAGSGT